MSDNTYNGFSNFATWAMNLEYVADLVDLWLDDGTRFESKHATATHMRDAFMDSMESECINGNSLLWTWAMRGISDVDWHDLAATHDELWADDVDSSDNTHDDTHDDDETTQKV